MNDCLQRIAHGVPDPRGRLSPRGASCGGPRSARPASPPAAGGPAGEAAGPAGSCKAEAAQAQQEEEAEEGGCCEARVRRFEPPLPGLRGGPSALRGRHG